MDSHGADFQAEDAPVDPGLTLAELILLRHLPVPETWQSHITTVFVLRCHEARFADMLPAAVGFLAIVLKGSGTLRFDEGARSPIHAELLLTPTSQAVAVDGEGPMEVIAAALSPLGWAALTGLHAGEHANRGYEAGAWLGPEVNRLGERLRQAHAGGAPAADLAGPLIDLIVGGLQPVNPDHSRLIAQVADWLSSDFDPPVGDLAARTAYSGRQLQRLMLRYFGAAPKLLTRKYRALRVAALLQDPQTSEERIAGMLNLFYDQSHAIREMRHFLGRTPALIGRGGPTLSSTASQLRNYREFRPNLARIPGD
jgi:AraC-like DNA-binding protein